MTTFDEGLWRWRRFAVDLLTAGAALAVVFATFGDAADLLALILLPGVLVGLSLMLEPHVSGRSDRGTLPVLLRAPGRAKPV
jgi:hypothetical protein